MSVVESSLCPSSNCEAVVPLGDSPQFAGMKADITNAVIQGMMDIRSLPEQNDGNSKVTLNVDGQAFAQLVLPKLIKEGGRKGYRMMVKGV